MEYTKDLILNVNMKEVNRKKEKGKTTWTSNILKNIKQHKTAAIATIALSLFVAVDIGLLTSFVSLLTKI